MRWVIIHIGKSGEQCLELRRRFLESALGDSLVSENAGLRKHVSVVDSSVVAPEAEVGKVGDEVAGCELIVGEISDFGLVCGALGSGFC